MLASGKEASCDEPHATCSTSSDGETESATMPSRPRPPVAPDGVAAGGEPTKVCERWQSSFAAFGPPKRQGTPPAPEVAPYGGMPWFDAFVENPSLPTNTCGSKDLSAANGAKCFDEACALPSAASFDCKAVDTTV